MIMESIELQPARLKTELDPPLKRPSIGGKSLGSRDTGDDDRNETLPSPTIATDQVETWNYPRRNIYKVSAAFWAFVIMGLNDATYGATIPYLQTYYHLEYAVVSLIFLSPFVGYNLSAVLNNAIHLKFGQRGVAVLGPLCHLVAYIVNAVHPPYPVLVISFMLAGFGNGLMDAGWNAWLGAMPNANEVWPTGTESASMTNMHLRS